ncbi:hypothetical protein SAMN05421503_1382 [Terribacillus aidingensis]|uniref:Uncharacterized protein n=1 Tax=Terribacillus aidingensis TaxID=586416 RepID=A0A285NLL0_9BACI|nr:HEPN domain-containing protein [Terribacillus aidingensis]SNZ09837.1 hypothetical protein SAMN05421503_1382 [Terribacillus aidingensis]
MKKKKYTMFEDFEIRGHWWSPSNPDVVIAGNLYYSSDEIRLELFGTLSDPISDINRYDLILGQTERGNITLQSGFIANLTLGRYNSSILVFRKLIIGKHFTKTEDIKFHSLYVNYTHLEEWMSHNPFTDDIVLEENKLTQAGLTYAYPPIFEARIESLKSTIKASYNFTANREKHIRRIFEHTSSLNIIPDTEQNIDWFLDVTQELQYLLTFLMNRPISVKRIIAKGDIVNEERNVRESIEIFIKPATEKEGAEIDANESFLSLNLIEEKIAEILSAWFNDEEIKPPRNILMRILYSKAVDGETTFLDYSKAIESFHRNTSGDAGKFMDDDGYKLIKDSMINAIPEGTDINLINKLKSTLDYAHHFGFRRRVKELLLGLPQELKDIMFESPKKLKNVPVDITNTRDYYTHLGELPSYYYKGWELLFTNQRLYAVLFYRISQRLNIKDDIIFSVIKNNDNLMYWLKTAKSELKN